MTLYFTSIFKLIFDWFSSQVALVVFCFFSFITKLNYFWKTVVLVFFFRNFMFCYNVLSSLFYIVYTQIWIFLLDKTIHVSFLDFVTQRVLSVFLIGLLLLVVVFPFILFQLNFRENTTLFSGALFIFFLPIFFITEASAADNTPVEIFADTIKNNNSDEITNISQVPANFQNNNIKEIERIAKNPLIYATVSESALNASKFLESRELIHEMYRIEKTEESLHSLPISKLIPTESVLVFPASKNPDIDSIQKFNAFFAQNPLNSFKIAAFGSDFFVFDDTTNKLVKIEDTNFNLNLKNYIENTKLKPKPLKISSSELNFITLSQHDAFSVDSSFNLVEISSHKTTYLWKKTLENLRTTPQINVQNLYVDQRGHFMFDRQGYGSDQKIIQKLFDNYTVLKEINNTSSIKRKLQLDIISWNLNANLAKTRVILPEQQLTDFFKCIRPLIKNNVYAKKF